MAGSKTQVTAITVQGQHGMSAEEVAAPVQDDVSQNLDTLIKTISDLSGQMSILSG